MRKEEALASVLTSLVISKLLASFKMKAGQSISPRKALNCVDSNLFKKSREVLRMFREFSILRYKMDRRAASPAEIKHRKKQQNKDVHLFHACNKEDFGNLLRDFLVISNL